jgi:hypothetical protein
MVTNRRQRHQAFLTCRTVGHAWFQIPAEFASYGDPLWFSCERCDTQRRDEIGSGGQLIKRAYKYPDGYQGYWSDIYPDAAPTRSDFRQMLLAENIVKTRLNRIAGKSGLEKRKGRT